MKNLYLLFLLTSSLFFYQKSYSQAYDFLDVNNVTARINASGCQFSYDRNSYTPTQIENNFYLFGDTLHRTIFSHDLWIAGTKRNNGMYCVAGGFMNSDYYPGPISDYYDSTFFYQWNRVWKITKSQIDSFKQWFLNPSSLPTYTMPDVIQLWPAHGLVQAGQSQYLAPFFDNNNDGYYNPYDGDYPLIKGDMAIWTVINDEFSSHISSLGNKLGFQIEIMAYAYDCNNCTGNAIFINYKITNRTNTIYDNTRIGFYNDFDIGYPFEDFVGTDIKRAMIYAYNSSDSDITLGKNPPAQGMIVLKGARKDNDGIDNPKYDSLGQQICDQSINGLNYGDGIVDNEINTLYGSMMNAENVSSYSDAIGQPQYALSIYNTMQFKYLDGVTMTYGGFGYDTTNTNPPSRYFAFGDSDPCYYATNGVIVNDSIPWYEYRHKNPPADKRILAIADPLSFYPDSTIEFDLAFVYARDSVEFSIPALQAVADTIIYNYRNALHPCNNPVLAAENYEIDIQQNPKIYPNPVDDFLYLEFEEASYYEIYDISGKTLKSGSLSQSAINSIDVSDLPNGIYIIMLKAKGEKIVKKFIK